MDFITSRENPKIKEAAKLLTSKSERIEKSLFIAEGARLCADAEKSGVVMREIFLTQRALEKYAEARALAENKTAKSYMISESAAQKIAGTKSPQGVFAVCEKPLLTKPESHAANARYFLLDGIQDPGNMGSIMRCAEAFGFNGICVSKDCAEIFGPKTLRASMGGAFRLPAWETGDMQKEIQKLQSEGVKAYATAITDSTGKLGDMPFLGPCAVLLGNEGAGLSGNLVKACDFTLTIKMTGAADSLGVAAAAGIFAWEMTK